MPSNTNAPSCWICLEEGLDDHGQPLSRNCACGGDSDWAHISFLASFAKVQTNGMSIDNFADVIMNCNYTAWTNCHICKQEYHGDLRVALGNKWKDTVVGLDEAS